MYGASGKEEKQQKYRMNCIPQPSRRPYVAPAGGFSDSKACHANEWKSKEIVKVAASTWGISLEVEATFNSIF